jgi:hypothetical protein
VYVPVQAFLQRELENIYGRNAVLKPTFLDVVQVN